MSPAARMAAPPPDGQFATFGRFRDWFLALLVALLLGLVGWIAQDKLGGAAHAEAKAADRYEQLEAEIRELRERMNVEYTATVKAQGEHGERLGKLETRISVENDEILKRLDRIESRLK